MFNEKENYKGWLIDVRYFNSAWLYYATKNKQYLVVDGTTSSEQVCGNFFKTKEEIKELIDKMAKTDQEAAAYLLPFVKAKAEGKRVMYRTSKDWGWWDMGSQPWDPSIEYKIEEPPQMEAEDWLAIARVKSKKTGCYLLVEGINPAGRKVEIGHNIHTFEEAAEKFTHLDGTTLGKPAP